MDPVVYGVCAVCFLMFAPLSLCFPSPYAAYVLLFLLVALGVLFLVACVWSHVANLKDREDEERNREATPDAHSGHAHWNTRDQYTRNHRRFPGGTGARHARHPRVDPPAAD
jgi:hypothetical protein